MALVCLEYNWGLSYFVVVSIFNSLSLFVSYFSYRLNLDPLGKKSRSAIFDTDTLPHNCSMEASIKNSYTL